MLHTETPYVVQSKDGQRFKVGKTCARRVYDAAGLGLELPNGLRVFWIRGTCP